MSNKIDMAAVIARVAAQKAAQKPTPPPVPLPDIPIVLHPDKPTGGVDFKKRLAALRERNKEIPPEQSPELIEEIKDNLKPLDELPADTTSTKEVTGMHGELITYNEKQQKFIDLSTSGESCVLLGAAGTGKTTCSQGAMAALLQQSGTIPVLNSDGHKHLVSGTPGIVIASYTRRAVNNIRKVQSEELKNNCITVHKLLEYQPVYYEIVDPVTHETRTTMRFEPARNLLNPLPSSIHTIVIEEGSMLGTDLYDKLIDALPHEVQWIFIGDIQQLPPVFGPAILGFKMLELPVVELTQVYRQALESPIIRLAHRILSGKPIPAVEYDDWKEKDKLTIHPWKKKISDEHAVLTLAAFFKRAIDTKNYDPENDMILIPYNKACGTLELNKHIANHLARNKYEDGELVPVRTHEVMAGFVKYYFSEGDKVLYDREDAEILEITSNPAYTGAAIQPSSVHLDYWGHNPHAAEERRAAAGQYGYDSDIDIDIMLDAVASSDERVNQSSHKILVRLLDSGTERTLTSAAEVHALLHAYALTVHKSQGSEWRKVFCCFHQSHAVMMQRELLYTAITRAREELYVLCEPETFTKGILSQRIKGDTLEEKAEHFKGKVRAANNGNGEK